MPNVNKAFVALPARKYTRLGTPQFSSLSELLSYHGSFGRGKRFLARDGARHVFQYIGTIEPNNTPPVAVATTGVKWNPKA